MPTFQPRPYQSRILAELRDEPAIALFMGTGTGKTLTSLFRFVENPTDKLLVICPKKVVSQWEDVIRNFDNTLDIMQFKKTSTADAKDKTILTQTADVIIVNFEIIHKLPSLITVLNNNWTIIVDESHKIKELGTRKSPVKVTKAVLTLGLLTPYKIILTATPTQKSYGGYIDYFTQLKFLGKMQMNMTDFKNRYCLEKDLVLPGRPYPIKEIIGYVRTNEIDEMLLKIGRRYVPKKGDFDPEHIKVKIDRTSSYAKVAREKVYKEILLDNVSRKRIALKTMASGTVFGYNEFRQKFSYNDNTNKMDWLEEFLSNTDETVVIYYQYNSELHDLEKLMQKMSKTYITINGETKDKYQAIKANYNVLLGQYQAAAESLDGIQHKSHIAIFYSMPESSLLYKQALGRIDRIGQTKVPIYYYLVMEKTIDETIFTMIEKKVEFSEEVLDRLLLEGKL
jgi:SNF2 family DNA or RNA helicase